MNIIRVGADLEVGATALPAWIRIQYPTWFTRDFRGSLCDFLDGPVRNAYRQRRAAARCLFFRRALDRGQTSCKPFLRFCIP